MFQLTSVPVSLDVVIFLSSVVILTPNGNFWVMPLLHSVSVICDPDLNCVFILMSVTKKYFRSHFLSLFERQNMKHCVQNLRKEYLILNTVSV